MKFATITPTRGDRPQFLDFCRHQLSRMNRKPDASYFVDYQPTASLSPDLVARVQKGIEMAQADGFDLVFIIEDDDYYNKNYFDHIPNAAFIGSEKTTYYNLRNRTFQEWDHPKRSSLFLTAFHISALDKFVWPEPQDVFLDLSLWNYVMRYRKQVIWRDVDAIGIKHGVGLCGGKGHIQKNKYLDMELEWLKNNVDSEAYIFYKSLKLK